MRNFGQEAARTRPQRIDGLTMSRSDPSSVCESVVAREAYQFKGINGREMYSLSIHNIKKIYKKSGRAVWW